jgi:hypothetical protein
MKRVGDCVRRFVDHVERAGKKPSERIRSSLDALDRIPAIVRA